jgi:multidrug efflux pump
MNQVIAQINAQNAVEGAGLLNAGSENLQVRVEGQFPTWTTCGVADPGHQPATGCASTLRLADIATSARLRRSAAP